MRFSLNLRYIFSIYCCQILENIKIIGLYKEEIWTPKHWTCNITTGRQLCPKTFGGRCMSCVDISIPYNPGNRSNVFEHDQKPPRRRTYGMLCVSRLWQRVANISSGVIIYSQRGANILTTRDCAFPIFIHRRNAFHVPHQYLLISGAAYIYIYISSFNARHQFNFHKAPAIFVLCTNIGRALWNWIC